MLTSCGVMPLHTPQMYSAFTKEETDSHCYRILARAESLRDFIVVAASLLGDLCDEVIDLYGLGEERSSSYTDFCMWAEDFLATEKIPSEKFQEWIGAAIVFDLYDALPHLNDWVLREKFVEDPFFKLEIYESTKTDEDLKRQQITHTCISLTNWVRSRTSERCL